MRIVLSFRIARSRVWQLALLLWGGISCGCMGIGAGQRTPPPANDPATAAAMEHEVERLRDRFEIESTELERQLQEQPLSEESMTIVRAWKRYLLEFTESALESSQPDQELLDLWAMTEQLETFADDPETVKQLGPAADALRETTQELNEATLDAAHKYLPEEVIEASDQSIREYVSGNPLYVNDLLSMGGTGVRKGLFSLFSAGKTTVGAMGAVANVPLLPGKAVQGMQEGADQFARLNVNAENFNKILQGLPGQARVEAEQLLTAINDNQTSLSRLLEDARASADSIARAGEQATRMGEQFDKTLATSSEAAAVYRETATAVEGASKATDQLVRSIDALMQTMREQAQAADGAASDGAPIRPEEIAQAATALQGASAELTLAMGSIESLIRLAREDDNKPDDGQPQGRPFDVLDYKTTADSLATASAGLTALLVELKTLTEGDALGNTAGALGAQLQPAVDHSAERLNGVIDHLALRLLQIMGVGFVLAAILIGLQRRKPNRSG
jgi:hypothetical protein